MNQGCSFALTAGSLFFTILIIPNLSVYFLFIPQRALLCSRGSIAKLMKKENKQIRDEAGGPNPTPHPQTTPWPLVLLLVGAGVVSAFQVGKAPPMLVSIRLNSG
jgi:hypothetical protein